MSNSHNISYKSAPISKFHVTKCLNFRIKPILDYLVKKNEKCVMDIDIYIDI